MATCVIDHPPDRMLARIADAIRSGGFAYIPQLPRLERPPQLVHRPASGVSLPLKAHWLELQRFWSDLPPDTYMADGGRYRRRRFGRVHWNGDGDTLEWLPPAGFFQSMELNRVNGGVVRHFEPLSPSFTRSPLLHALISLTGDLVRRLHPAARWTVNVHQIRIEASPAMEGLPAPEGIHRDGHHFVLQMLIDRWQVAGGETQVFDRDGRLAFQRILQEPGESLLLDDTRLLHFATPITVAKGASKGHRSMLILDFNPVER